MVEYVCVCNGYVRGGNKGFRSKKIVNAGVALHQGIAIAGKSDFSVMHDTKCVNPMPFFVDEGREPVPLVRCFSVGV